VGAGKMSELAARHLLAHGAEAIFVANRTYDRAIGLAHKFKGQAIEFSRLYDTCERADIVITSTGSPHFIFRREPRRTVSGSPQKSAHVLHRHRRAPRC